MGILLKWPTRAQTLRYLCSLNQYTRDTKVMLQKQHTNYSLFPVRKITWSWRTYI